MKLHKTKENEIYYYYLKNGDKRYMYRHKYVDVLGKRKEKKKSGFNTKKEALRSLLEVQAAILNGDSNQIEHSQMTVSQLLDIWLDTKKRSWKASSFNNNKVVIENHLKPMIGHYKISKLTAATYEREFINKKIDNGFKPNSINRYHTLFKTAVNFAVDEDIISKNRFSKVKVDTHDQLDNFLTPSELKTFLEHANKVGDLTEWTLAFLLAYSGLRKGEAYALKWSDIDFDNNTIKIQATRDFYGFRAPKTKGSYRTIEIDIAVMNQLSRYLNHCKKAKMTYGVQNKTSDLVFISMHDNQPVDCNYINRFFERLYSTIEQDYKVKLKRITPHGLRHTHATILIDMLIPPPDIAERLGNSLEMIYNVYVHSFKKTENKSVSAFSNGLTGAKFGAN